jgi:DNA helicase-2/ATP-dependent DNA helicase PcrA
VSLFEAARRAEVRDALRPAARTALAEFVNVIEKLRATAPNVGVDELLRELVDTIKYGDHLKAEGPDWQERGENVRSLIDGAAETVIDDGGEVGLTPLDHFLQKATLVAGVDALDPNADAVTLMTMHNAKGLEFPIVFVAGLEDGLFPLARAAEDPKQLEEERRLFYVGITRAEKKLYLTTAEQRRRNGELMISMPSRFLRSVTPALAERQKTMRARTEGRNAYGGAGRSSSSSSSDSWGKSSYTNSPRRSAGPYGSAATRGGKTTDEPAFGAAPAGWGTARGSVRPSAPQPEDESQDMPILAAGARVRHAKFGSGTIAELTGNGRDAKVRIDFDDEEVGRKTLVLAQAKLEPAID